MNIRHNRKGTRRIRIISKIGKEPVSMAALGSFFPDTILVFMRMEQTSSRALNLSLQMVAIGL
jgi:hypothetical protein